jgi:hypothetical protein
MGIEIVDTLPTGSKQETGEALMNELYREHNADQVALIEVNLKAEFQEDKYNVLAKIERNCKHLGGLQRQFRFDKADSQLICEECSLKFDSGIKINEEWVTA